MYTLTKTDIHGVAVGWNGYTTPKTSVNVMPCMRASQGGEGYGVATPAAEVRRLTPKECERLQGFEDGYTNAPFKGKSAADGNRYKALGNSMAVPVMRYIGQKIQEAVEYPIRDLL